MKPFKKLFISLFVYFLHLSAQAAACCGGGFVLPTLITGDDDAILTATFSQSRVDTDVFSSGVWQKRSGDDLTKIYKIEGARIFRDRFQYGFSFPIETRERSGDLGGSATGLADIALQAGYEFLPDWDYNPWRPRGLSFLSLTLPTGKSIYESDDPLALDSRGRGFFALGAGVAMTKNWTKWDANSSFEIHHAFQKNVNSSQINGKVKPGNGGTFSFGTGYNFKNIRIGSSATWIYEDAIQVENESSTGSAQRFATATLLASFLINEHWAATLSHSDQTLLGSPSNTSLTKSVALSLQRRWQR